MPESQIQVKLNPDTPPTGTDLSVVNAARRSFNSRSDWDRVILSQQELEESGAEYNDWEKADSFYDPYVGYELRKLKDKDKRLIQFLARGMTADDFEVFVNTLDRCVVDGLDEDFEETAKLLWQWRNTPTHDTPFNHTFISFEVKAPIFVARQLVKTEYSLFSEFSRRYITDDVEFYEHSYRRKAENKKQGSGDAHEDSLEWSKAAMRRNYEALDFYNQLLKADISPEQARGVLPQDLMTAWTWSGTLGAFAKMCRERLHPDAQYESRLVAQQVYGYLKKQWPMSAKALVEGPDV